MSKSFLWLSVGVDHSVSLRRTGTGPRKKATLQHEAWRSSESFAAEPSKFRLGGGVNISDDDDEPVRIETLSDAQLIKILQLHGYDDGITRMLEAEIARRKKEGGRH